MTAEDREPMRQIAVRLPPSLIARLDALAAAERRDRTALLRIITEDGLPARERAVGLAPEPDWVSDQADDLARAKARALSPDTQQRLRESRAATAAPHPFRPSAGNSLKCECGVRIKDHG